MSDGYEHLVGRVFVVVRNSDKTVFGPFEDEKDAVGWAKAQPWRREGWFVRPMTQPQP